MVRPTPPLLAFLKSRRLRERIRVALHSGNVSRIVGPVVFAENWSGLGELSESNPGSPAVIDPFLPDEDVVPSGEPLKRFAARWPSTPLISYTRLTTARRQRLPDTDFSFAAVLLPGSNDDLETMDSVILRSIDTQRTQQLVERVGQARCLDASRIFRHALNLAIGPSAVAELAASLGFSERTLYRRCTRLGIRSAGTILALARVFTIEHLTEWSRQAGGAVAVALGVSDRHNYRRLVRQNLGVPPSTLRRQSGADHLEESIVRALTATPTPPTDPKHPQPSPKPPSPVPLSASLSSFPTDM